MCWSLSQSSILIQVTPTTFIQWHSRSIWDAWSHSLLKHSIKTQLQNWRNPRAGGQILTTQDEGEQCWALSWRTIQFSTMGTQEVHWRVKRCHWLKGSRCLATGFQLSVDYNFNFSTRRWLSEVLRIVYLIVFWLWKLQEGKIASEKLKTFNTEPRNFYLSFF